MQIIYHTYINYLLVYVSLEKKTKKIEVNILQSTCRYSVYYL